MERWDQSGPQPETPDARFIHKANLLISREEDYSSFPSDEYSINNLATILLHLFLLKANPLSPPFF